MSISQKKKKRFYISVVLVYLIAVTLISATHAEIKADSASNALNEFALKFLAETSSKLPDSMNLAISPYTVWTAMAIVNEGARGNTAKELERTLYIPPNGTDRQSFRVLQQRLIQNIAQKYEGVTLEVLNSMFTRLEATLNPDFVKLVQDVYNVQVQPLDFKNSTGAAKYINRVISDATRGRIPEIVTSDTVNDAYMFLTSALFFKGLWDKKFDKADTKQQPFYNEQKQPIGVVSMMQTTGAFPFGQVLGGKALAVELPYIGADGTVMIAIVPRGSNTLSSILTALAATPMKQVLAEVHEHDDFEDDNILVHLPKFKISSQLNLNYILYIMGAQTVFNEDSADLSGISSTLQLYVSRVLHATEIEVDEEGTVASSATGVASTGRGSPAKFNANRPFAFVIYDKRTQSVIFAGRVTNPNGV